MDALAVDTERIGAHLEVDVVQETAQAEWRPLDLQRQPHMYSI